MRSSIALRNCLENNAMANRCFLFHTFYRNAGCPSFLSDNIKIWFSIVNHLEYLANYINGENRRSTIFVPVTLRPSGSPRAQTGSGEMSGNIRWIL